MQPIEDIKIIKFLDWFDQRRYDITCYMHDSRYQDNIDNDVIRRHLARLK